MKPKKLNPFRVDEILENKRLIQAIADANPCFRIPEIRNSISLLRVNQNMIDLISAYMNWEENQFIAPDEITTQDIWDLLETIKINCNPKNNQI